MKRLRSSRIFYLVLVFFCLFQIKSFASIPQPSRDYYLDELNVLDEKTKENINKTNKELESKTGAQVIVITLENNEGYEGNSFGTDIFNNWHIGDKEKENGVLILLLDDKISNRRQINIITGYGIEGRLNDGKVGRIIDNFMLDSLKAGDYSTGLNEGFNAVVGEIAAEYDISLDGNYEAYQEELADYDDGGFDLFSIIVIVFIIIIFLNMRRNMRRYRRNPFGRRYRRFYDDDDDFGPWFGGGSFGGFGGSSFGGGSSGGFSGGGGSSGGGGAGRSF